MEGKEFADGADTGGRRRAGHQEPARAHPGPVSYTHLVYLAFLAWIVLLKGQFSLEVAGTMRSVNLVPLAGATVINGAADYREAVENLLAFLPFGLYLGMLAGHRPLWRGVAAVAAVSLGFEVLQLSLIHIFRDRFHRRKRANRARGHQGTGSRGARADRRSRQRRPLRLLSPHQRVRQRPSRRWRFPFDSDPTSWFTLEALNPTPTSGGPHDPCACLLYTSSTAQNKAERSNAWNA